MAEGIERRELDLPPARRFTPVAIAVLLIACASIVSPSRAANPRGACEDETGLAMLSSPIAAWKGAPLRVVFAAEKPLEGELSLIAPDGKVAATSRERTGGPPYVWFAEVAAPEAGPRAILKVAGFPHL